MADSVGHNRTKLQPPIRAIEVDDPVESMINRTGCLKEHYTVQECMAEHKDWRRCQDHVAAFKKCIEESKKSKDNLPTV